MNIPCVRQARVGISCEQNASKRKRVLRPLIQHHCIDTISGAFMLNIGSCHCVCHTYCPASCQTPRKQLTCHRESYETHGDLTCYDVSENTPGPLKTCWCNARHVEQTWMASYCSVNQSGTCRSLRVSQRSHFMVQLHSIITQP